LLLDEEMEECVHGLGYFAFALEYCIALHRLRLEEECFGGFYSYRVIDIPTISWFI
jgi:hypothetical protein